MPLYWLCYRYNNHISVVIEPGASPIHARMRSALAGLDQGAFTEGHELDSKTEKQVRWESRKMPEFCGRNGDTKIDTAAIRHQRKHQQTLAVLSDTAIDTAT